MTLLKNCVSAVGKAKQRASPNRPVVGRFEALGQRNELRFAQFFLLLLRSFSFSFLFKIKLKATNKRGRQEETCGRDKEKERENGLNTILLALVFRSFPFLWISWNVRLMTTRQQLLKNCTNWINGKELIRLKFEGEKKINIYIVDDGRWRWLHKMCLLYTFNAKHMPPMISAGPGEVCARPAAKTGPFIHSFIYWMNESDSRTRKCNSIGIVNKMLFLLTTLDGWW